MKVTSSIRLQIQLCYCGNIIHFKYESEIILSILPVGVKSGYFGSKIMKILETMRVEVTKHFRMLHNEEVCDLYRSASIVVAGAAQLV